MGLEAWNQRLANHFGALADDRKDHPLFALEHGLAAAEVLSLSDEVRAHILVSSPSPKHELVWAVYAAEIGYSYAGDEYWQTFEAKTPGWTANGNRSWIRDTFAAFQRRFSAAMPSGPWAEQFSIIAWPITHAILPRDLQQQLARTLYDHRHEFSAELFYVPQLLGEFIAARSCSMSARFRNLVQAPALVGQIAAALLLQGKQDFKPLLHPMTLKRIGDDVDRERRGRDWLLGARSAAEERAKIRGLAIGKPAGTTYQRPDEARSEVIRLGIEPRLLLRPIEGSRWEVLLQIPDLSHLLLRFPDLREVLTGSRCLVAGSAGRPLARGRCLHGPQRIPLSRWPRPDDVLLKFERTDAQLDYLLRAECMLRPGSSWLFKVASDGLAYESRGLRVSAGSKYLLVSNAEIALPYVALPLELTCEGVYAALLDVPDPLTPEWEQALKQLEVSQAKSIEVWPAGLAAVTWDGESHGEWLNTERPILAINSDHPFEELTIAIVDGPSLSLTRTDFSPGKPIFIELPSLPVGLHKCTISTRTGNGAEYNAIGDLEVLIRIRAVRPWAPGAYAHGSFEVELDPAAPSLEQLWEGAAAFQVRGPTGRQGKCRVKMFARTGDVALLDRELPAFTLPLSNEEWTRHFEAHIKKDKAATRVYDEAYVCEVEFSADELGSYTLRCDREFTPLRWSVRRKYDGFVVRLHDDAGTGEVIIERFTFERPTVCERIATSSEHKAPRVGGLYLATLGDLKAAIIVPPIVEGLAGLSCEPIMGTSPRTVETIIRVLTIAQLWGKARLPGDPIAGYRRKVVLRAITAHLAALLGGHIWASAESKLVDERGLVDLKRVIPDKEGAQGISLELQLAYVKLASEPPRTRVQTFCFLAESFRLTLPKSNQSESVGRSSLSGPKVTRPVQGVGPEHSAWLSEFVLRLVSDPGTVNDWAGEFVDASVRKLLLAPTLVRAARFLVLAVDQHKKSGIASGEVYAGWGWSA